MKTFELIATSTFGLETIVRREVEDLGYEINEVTDGKVTYTGDVEAIVLSNLWLRSADRVLL
ncbi:MAG: class I SAM-dependent RNA methyltransferase, partial [Cellulosilyticaceae bacterium]